MCQYELGNIYRVDLTTSCGAGCVIYLGVLETLNPVRRRALLFERPNTVEGATWNPKEP